MSENVIIRWTHQQGEGTPPTSCSCFCSSLLVLLLADRSYFRSWNSQIYNFGLPKTHLAHVAIATAMNVVQLTHWLNRETPEQTRTSAFKQVMKQTT